MRRIHLVGAGVLAVGLAATMAFGADGEPKKANKYQATMVHDSAVCTTPTESTLGGLPLPACPESSSATCQFGDKGSGKVAAKAKDDVALSLKIGGLENCADGTILQAYASFRTDTNNCSVSSRCTTFALQNFPIPGATCTVANGKCKLKTTLNTLVPGAITPGKNTSIILGEVGVMAGTTAVAKAGLLVP